MARNAMKWLGIHESVMDDSGILTEVITHAHEPGKIYTRRTQPNSHKILELNKRMRIEKPHKDLSFGRWFAQVPLNDWMILVKKYPELRAKDVDIREKALAKLVKSDEFKPYLVN